MAKIVFTGGSGKAGRHVVPYLLSKGHRVLNLDIVPFPATAGAASDVYTLKTDLTDSGQVFNALTGQFHIKDFELQRREEADVVIHFAAQARNMLLPDNETFRQNTISTYNIIEAACKVGIKKIIIASSETTYGSCFAQGDHSRFVSMPLHEELPVVPEDTYAMSKVTGEVVARGFAKRFGVDIYALRIGNVIEPHEYETLVPDWLDRPETRYRNAWSYMDARDLGQICHLCIEKSGLGFQIFNATNDTITTRTTTKDTLDQFCKDIPITREMGDDEGPLSNRKIKDVLGFKEEHNWKMYVH